MLNYQKSFPKYKNYDYTLSSEITLQKYEKEKTNLLFNINMISFNVALKVLGT